VALRFARPLYSWIVLDLARPSSFNQPLLDECSEIVLVTNSGISSLRATKHIAASLPPGLKPKLLITEGHQPSEISMPQLGDLLGITDCRRLPDANRELYEALAAGGVLPQSSPLRKALGALAAEWTNREVRRQEKPIGRLRALLGSVTRRATVPAKSPAGAMADSCM
jgi:Flp pilus assembly CpaE family ATPase